MSKYYFDNKSHFDFARYEKEEGILVKKEQAKQEYWKTRTLLNYCNKLLKRREK